MANSCKVSVFKELYPRWAESVPPKNASMLYFAFGYGLIYIGQSGRPRKHQNDTLKNKKWATHFLWINLSPAGLFATIDRKRLEAQVIFRMFQRKNLLGENFSLVNRQFIHSLGKHSQAPLVPNDLIDLLISFFVQKIKAHPDPRGRYSSDVAIWRDESETDEARFEAYIRLVTHRAGRNRNSESPKCLELKLVPSHEKTASRNLRCI